MLSNKGWYKSTKQGEKSIKEVYKAMTTFQGWLEFTKLKILRTYEPHTIYREKQRLI